MSPLLDRSNPLAVRIASGVMVVAMLAALSWALTLLFEASDRPKRILFIAGVMLALSLATRVCKRVWSRRKS